MKRKVPLADTAALMSDPARSAMLIALLSGRAHTAGELALTADVSAQNASGHLRKLINGNLVTVESSGRHRYFRLASPEIGLAIESIAAISPQSKNPFNQLEPLSEVRFCRVCYDHLAGRFAVALTDFFLAQRFIEEGEKEFFVTHAGEQFFSTLDVDVALLRLKRRAFARRCLDWTERKPHIAGALGNAIFERLKVLKWISRIQGSRAIRFTLNGQEQLIRCFSMRDVFARASSRKPDGERAVSLAAGQK